MMVRMAKGTALQAYLAMKADCKMQFQGQVLVRHQVRNDKGKQSDSNLVENSSGVRAQIEREADLFSQRASLLLWKKKSSIMTNNLNEILFGLFEFRNETNGTQNIRWDRERALK